MLALEQHNEFETDDTTVVEIACDSLAARLAARRNTRPDMQLDERFTKLMSLADQVRAVSQ